MGKGDNRQKGNALFLILIAVALFAALSYAVTQSGRGGGAGVDSEKASLAASQLLQMTTNLKIAIDRMMIKGVDPASLDFSSSGAGANAVFAADGGGADWITPPAAVSANDFVYWETVDGCSINGVGTANPDVVIRVTAVDDAVCQAINEGLGLAWPAPQDGGGDSIDLDGFDGEPVGCQRNWADTAYIYFHVLVPQ